MPHPITLLQIARLSLLPVAALSLVSCAALNAEPVSLASAAASLKADDTASLSFAATGRWYQFGQAPAPGLPWPAFEVSRYVADIDYRTQAERVQISRKQIIEAGRERPAPVEQLVDQYLAGNQAWNRSVSTTNTANAAAAPTVTAAPASVAERQADIASTPQGFIKAAQAHQAILRNVGQGSTEVSFNIDARTRYVGWLNSRNEVERVQTWIDTPVLGDTLVETRFDGYRNFAGLPFPAHIVRSQGGHPVLDLQVSDVQRKPSLSISIPAEVASAPASPIVVTSNSLAPGVYYLTGGTHHSVLIEQRDHLVIVEAPLNEERSLAVIAKARELVPAKPIKYLVNTHAHFDHSGGLRTYVDAGATIVTAQANRAFYEQAWAAPRSLNPDRLAASHQPARFETFTGKHVLSDGQRKIELHEIAGNGHNDAFALVYLPAEKILIEADAYTPVAANVPPPATPNPYSVNLYANVRKLKLDVTQIAALHGPRVVTLDDLRATIGAAAVAQQ